MIVDQGIKIIDWFIPGSALLERSDRSIARNFVFTHLLGPTLSHLISLFLYRTDPNPGFACGTIVVCISLFWTLPFVFRWTKDLRLVAALSVELLIFTSLFGTFNYGGVGSPFLPWLIIALLLGFFYLSANKFFVLGLFAANFIGFVSCYLIIGFPQIVPLWKLEQVGWISIFSATVYMSWMAIYYGNVMSNRSEIEIEMERHRKTAESLKETKQLAVAANRAKSIFLAKMSHEFRTPLNAVIGYSELVLEGLDPATASKQKESDLKRISSAGKHLLALVSDILDLSKIESDEIELVAAEFNLDDFCSELVATVEPLVRKNGNTLVFQALSKLGGVVADETKLRQIILNLLSNAAKFTRNGTITVTAKRQTIASFHWIEFRVRDTGIGIAQDDIPKLFNNFQQATAGTSRNFGGTGLGLAISQKLCTLMGGSVTVMSELGKGSCFVVRVPAGTAEVTGTSPAADSLPPLALAAR